VLIQTKFIGKEGDVPSLDERGLRAKLINRKRVASFPKTLPAQTSLSSADTPHGPQPCIRSSFKDTTLLVSAGMGVAT
jgi:hypothetical protein